MAKKSLPPSAQEEIETSVSADLTIKGDGPWKTCRNTSLVGACTIIGSKSS